ncbi:MAG TPA: hypothetical protein VMG59_03840 [Phycisphaerae bacterium]|nr:hypothetical protein [Phycisphaerae bacterium]
MEIKCSKCGKDVSNAAHFRDASGNYFCTECQTSAVKPGDKGIPPPVSTAPSEPGPGAAAQPPVYHYMQQPAQVPQKANVLGILSFIFSLLGIFFIITAPIGLILGILGLRRQPRGLALAGTIIGGMMTAVLPIMALMIAILLPSLAKAKELANRTECEANIRSILQSMTIYAQSNNATFPCVLGSVDSTGDYGNSASNIPSNLASAPGSNTADIIISSWYSTSDANSAADGAASPLGSLWILVLQGQLTPKTFICPSDPFANAPSQEYAVVNGTVTPNFPNFGFMTTTGTTVSDSGQGESYSIDFPYAYSPNASTSAPLSAGGWWVNDSHADQPIVSDMAPQSGVGSGTFERNTTVTFQDNTFGPYIFNSGNHNGDGQNVGFADTHVEWDTTPYVGEQGDNIFTYNNSAAFPNGNQQGITGTGGNGTIGLNTFQPTVPPYDTVMVPVRNVETGAW